MESAESGTWWLAAHNPFAEPRQGKTEFIKVRPLSSDEVSRARRANIALGQLAYTAQYGHLKELYDRVEALSRHRGADRRLIESPLSFRTVGVTDHVFE